MKNKEIDDIVFEKVISRIEEIKKFSVEVLLSLPPINLEQIEVGGKTLDFCTYRDLLANGETLIIVQCKNTRFLGYGKMFAKGLVIDANKAVRDAEQELTWEYV